MHYMHIKIIVGVFENDQQNVNKTLCKTQNYFTVQVV
jgi:hypothetical protein